MRDLYKEAVVWGRKKAIEDAEQISVPAIESRELTDRAQYWSAWWAARRATDAVLEAAKKLELDDDQFETLRQVAAEVAYD